MSALKFSFRQMVLAFLCISVVGLSVVRGAQAQTIANCPESYFQISGPTCIPNWSDLSITTCAVAGASHGITISTLLGVITAQFALHAIYLDMVFFGQGLMPALGDMAQQISIGHMEQAKEMAHIIDNQKEGDTMRFIQKHKIKGIVAQLPSEEHCKMVSATGGVAAANNLSKARVRQNQNFLLQAASSRENSIMGASNGGEFRMESICRYITEDGDDNSAFSEVCQGVDPEDSGVAGNMLAFYLEEETIGDEAVEPINNAMLSMFFDNPPGAVDPRLFENNNMKLAYMDHRSVLSRQLLTSYCFQKTFEDRLGGTPMTTFQRETLNQMGMSDDYIEQKIGDNPSAYAQKKLLMNIAMNPKFGVELNDSKENILRLASGVQSHKMATLFDTLEILHCNEMVLSQLLNDKLIPMKADLQERFDTILATKENENQTEYAVNVLMPIEEHGEGLN
ncbi:MAG: hypothetical protein ACPG05_00020 [Bdellovibrionales bacterium]